MTPAAGTYELTPQQRTYVRKAAGLSPHDVHVPVIIVDADMPPLQCGRRGGWHTLAGDTIIFPAAYRRVAWSNAVYVRSTLRIYVGDKWLRDHFGPQPSSPVSRQPRKITIKS